MITPDFNSDILDEDDRKNIDDWTDDAIYEWSLVKVIYTHSDNPIVNDYREWESEMIRYCKYLIQIGAVKNAPVATV